MQNQRGFGLIEVLMSVSIMSILALGIAGMMARQATMNSILASQNSNTALGAAIRTQLARRASCMASLSPPSFPGGGPVAVRLGPNDETQLVQTGASLPAWKTNIRSLKLDNVTQYGTTNSGNSVYIGDILLQSLSTDLKPGLRAQMKEFVVARMTFEVSGGAMVACYAGDPYSDTTQTLEQVCRMVASPDGTPASWSNGMCIVRDQKQETTCAQQGGTWAGNGCNVTQVVDAGQMCSKLGGTWGGSGCQLTATQIIQQTITTNTTTTTPGGPTETTGGGGSAAGSCDGYPQGSVKARSDGCNYDRCINGHWAMAFGNCETNADHG
jgi:prepilin-type N-terminal cleavage/methylation domain-containing protein